MIVKTAISFLNKDLPQAIANKTDVIIGAMNDPQAKLVYVNPVPTIATVETANAGLKTALLDYQAAGGGKQLSAAVTARTAEVSSLVRQLAAYVTATANGDMENLLLSGFPIQKPNRQPIGQLPAPLAPTVKQGTSSGQLKAATPPVYGGMSYNWRVARAAAPTVYVQTTQTTAASTTFDGLTAGEIYNVEANTVGAAGPSDWSDPGSLMVI
jgi:hypothetical protein